MSASKRRNIEYANVRKNITEAWETKDAFSPGLLKIVCKFLRSAHAGHLVICRSGEWFIKKLIKKEVYVYSWSLRDNCIARLCHRQTTESNQKPPVYLRTTMPKTDSTAKVCSCPTKERRYVPHKHKLMVLVCANCGCRKRSTKSVTDYNKKRRKLRLAEDLETISFSLTASSTTLIECALASASLAKHKAFAHVTLVEGLRAPLPDQHMRALSAALASAKTLTICDATLMARTHEKNFRLVTLELEPATALAIQVRTLALTTGCMLPQWKLHIGLGLAPKDLATRAARALLRAYGGTALTIDADRLHAFSPIAEENTFPETIQCASSTETKPLGSTTEGVQQYPVSLRAAIPNQSAPRTGAPVLASSAMCRTDAS